MFDHGGFEALLAAREPRHHRSQGYFQDVRDLLVGEFFQIIQDQDRPVALGQYLEALVNLDGRGLALQGLQCVFTGRKIFQVIDIIVIDAIVIFLIGTAAPAPDPFKEVVAS